MFIDLYSIFDQGTLRGPEQQEQLRINQINDIIRIWGACTQSQRMELIESNDITDDELNRINTTSEIIKKYKKMIERNKDKEYQIEVKDISALQLLKDTERILSVLYTDYIANEQEKEIIKNKERMIR